MNNNPHDDILGTEIPEDGPKRRNLLEELKTRAKGAFQAKDLRNAEMLYSKAIDCVEFAAGSATGEHLLYSNRAAVRLLLKKNDDAVSDCDKCLKIDPDFIKAHFRKAQAQMRLNKFKEAIDACKLGIERHPGNSELASLQQEIQTEWDKDLEAKKNFNAEANEVRPDLPVPEPTRIPLTKPASVDENKPCPKKAKPDTSSNSDSTASTQSQSTSSSAVGGNKQNAQAGASESNSNPMRGYKKTADGKTTSYFHTELSAEAKALIGDCKPKKIEAPVESGAKVGSAWNQAGTFEERNYTKWFHEKVRESFPKDTKCALPNGIPAITVNLDTVSGDANIACTRGKVKYIHDVCVTCKWKFTTKDEKRAEGTIKMEADGDGDFDVNVEVDNKTHSSTRSIVNEFVKSSGKGLQRFLEDKVRAIEKEFQAIKI
mmetsp:Transcript_8060/g.19472  ORF Transcript_8060/g.19472 Transcript_8060/m.19472 type:complete len:430 (-) Transcript_8060:114-1403(-)|eukprot:g9941.t1